MKLIRIQADLIIFKYLSKYYAEVLIKNNILFQILLISFLDLHKISIVVSFVEVKD